MFGYVCMNFLKYKNEEKYLEWMWKRISNYVEWWITSKVCQVMRGISSYSILDREIYLNC